MAILGTFAGYILGSSNNQQLYDAGNVILHSERDLEAAQNIKTLIGLRENRLDETIKFLQVRVDSALKMEGIKESTFSQAREYQQKYCKDSCLGLKKTGSE